MLRVVSVLSMRLKSARLEDAFRLMVFRSSTVAPSKETGALKATLAVSNWVIVAARVVSAEVVKLMVISSAPAPPFRTSPSP